MSLNIRDEGFKFHGRPKSRISVILFSWIFCLCLYKFNTFQTMGRGSHLLCINRSFSKQYSILLSWLNMSSWFAEMKKKLTSPYSLPITPLLRPDLSNVTWAVLRVRYLKKNEGGMFIPASLVEYFRSL